MTNIFGSRITYASRVGHLYRLYSVGAAILNWAHGFVGIIRDGLADRFIRIWRIFRQEPSREEPIFSDRTGIPQGFYEIRNRAFLDFNRNIR